MRRLTSPTIWALLIAYALAVVSLSGCGYVAAGAAGAVVGHEVAEDDEDDE